MEILLVLILAIVVIFAIAPKFLPSISSKLTQLTVKSSAEEVQHKEELKRLKNELYSIHMVNEFPKYARTERRINKLKSEIQSLGRNRTEVFVKIKFILNIVFHVVQAVVYFSLIYQYRYDPVIIVPSEWLFPVGSIISFPTLVSGGVSTAIWIVACRNTIGKAKFLISRA